MVCHGVHSCWATKGVLEMCPCPICFSTSVYIGNSEVSASFTGNPQIAFFTWDWPNLDTPQVSLTLPFPTSAKGL